jgi:hypothetical protein
VDHTVSADGDMTSGDLASLAYIAVRRLVAIENDLEKV